MGIVMIYSTMIATKDKLGALLRLVPIISLSFSLYFWYLNPLLRDNGPLIFLVHGVIFSAICSRLIICSVSRQYNEWFDLCAALELLMLMEAQYIGYLSGYSTLIAFSIFVIFSYSSFVIGVVGQITSHLNISVFLVKG